MHQFNFGDGDHKGERSQLRTYVLKTQKKNKILFRITYKIILVHVPKKKDDIVIKFLTIIIILIN